ncbi:HAD-IA family hydrolase [Mesorhizobium sp. M0129]|uniref:HAD-IIA family hydrolase n=1 Tax=Mesorhizobium sp. M0129 TaxID=2956886 RepID=UPI00333A9DC2
MTNDTQQTACGDATYRCEQGGGRRAPDYAMTGSQAGGFSGCKCGAPHCRGKITRDDWRIRAFQEAYQGYFAPFKTRAVQLGTESACALTAALDSLPTLERPPQTLADCYDAILFDAMGVLISENEALPGAADILARLNMSGQPYYIVTNISSGSDETIFARLRGAGLPIPAVDRIVSAGGVARHRVLEELAAGRLVSYVGSAHAAHEIFAKHPNLHCADTAETFDTLVVLDDEGFDFKRAADHILSTFQRRLSETGEMPCIIAANADIIYPGKNGSLVFGPSIIGPMLQAGLAPFGAPPISVESMGKPGRAIFEECIARAGTDRLLMIGDQVDTDIKGAKAAGLDALLVTTGLNNCGELRQDENGAPDYVAKNLDQIFDGSLFPHLRSAKHSSTTDQVWAAWSENRGADKAGLGGSG